MPIPAISSWIFKHDLVELCTAVKGPMLELLVEREIEKVIYLDPDIALLAPLDGVVRELDDASIVLTPHQLDPDTDEMAIFDNEVGSASRQLQPRVRCGSQRRDRTTFRGWFAERLRSYCYDNQIVVFLSTKSGATWCRHSSSE